MSIIGAKQHFWEYLPELGPDWKWCPRCKKAEHIPSRRRMSYKKALAEAQMQADCDEALQSIPDFVRRPQ